jgi:hypothetical protein
MLAYFMTSPGSNHAITLPARIASPAAQPAALVRAQQLAAAAKKRHRKQAVPVHGMPVLGRSRRM